MDSLFRSLAQGDDDAGRAETFGFCHLVLVIALSPLFFLTMLISAIICSTRGLQSPFHGFISSVWLPLFLRFVLFFAERIEEKADYHLHALGSDWKKLSRSFLCLSLSSSSLLQAVQPPPPHTHTPCLRTYIFRFSSRSDEKEVPKIPKRAQQEEKKQGTDKKSCHQLSFFLFVFCSIATNASFVSLISYNRHECIPSDSISVYVPVGRQGQARRAPRPQPLRQSDPIGQRQRA